MSRLTKNLCILAFSILLLCTMVIPTMAATTDSCAHQAAIDDKHYDTLAEALEEAREGSTVTLLADVAHSGMLTIDTAITLDLNTHTLSGQPSEDQAAFLRISGDTTLKNGKITAAEGVAVLVQDCLLTIEKTVRIDGCGEAATLQLTASKDGETRVSLAGQLTGKGPAAVVEAVSEEGSCQLEVLKKAKITAKDNPAIHFDTAGALEITDGTIKTKKDAISVTLAKKRPTDLSVTGGKILCTEGEAFVMVLKKGVKSPAPFVTGGTYKKVPTAYVPDYCQIRDNKDGTYTVISDYIISFRPGSGSGTMQSVKVRCGEATLLPQCAFTPAEGMEFAGWEIDGTVYDAEEAFTPTKNVTAIAQWKTHTHTGGTATCAKKALCETCGEAYGSYGSHSLSHSGGYAPTCDQGGMAPHSVCAYCGSCFADGVETTEYALLTPALGHDWQEQEGVSATCQADGVHTHNLCKTCGQLQMEGRPVTEEELVIPAGGHTMESVAATQATCAEAGIQAHEHCTTCDQLFLNGAEVKMDALTTAQSSHTLSDWVSDELYHWKTCVDCQEVFRQSSHADFDQDGLCDDCGAQLAQAQQSGILSGNRFSLLFLTPMLAAVIIAVLLILRKRK